MRDWQILKLLLRPVPTRRGKTETSQTKNSYKYTRIKSRTKQPAKHHLQLEVHKQCHRHTPTTPKTQAQPAQPGTQPIHKQKYIGTLSSSQTTHAHPHQPVLNQSAPSSGSQRYTQGKQKSKSRTTPTKQPANQACNTVKLSRSHCDLLARGNEKILNHLHNKHANPQRSGGFQASKVINKR